ncbi:MAG: transposase [Armatimonadetes bacterium]|nr:transposase [Armatimonadota bacterium]
MISLTICAKDRHPLFADPSSACSLMCVAEEVFSEMLSAICIMPDHVHLVVATVEGRSFTRVFRQFKGKASYVLHRLGAAKDIWERSIWDRHARKDEDVSAMVEYVLSNPVRRELCSRPEDWPYSKYYGFPWTR